jgi:hypothetical protein
MNERLEHCLYQAGLTAQGCWDELDDYAKEGIVKFAELIVEKCAGIIESQDVDPSFKLRMSWAVKEYFGIEQ